MILERICEDKVIHTILRKRTMKKLIIDFFDKTTFRFNNKIYKQMDRVSIGSSLRPVPCEYYRDWKGKGYCKRFRR